MQASSDDLEFELAANDALSVSVRHLPRENGKIIIPRLSLFIPFLIIAFSVIHMIFICSTSAGLSSLFW